ncbi:hypothetical protein WJX73_008421 [Symbiochloris irregularis]|uniref:sn-1-specific diacylglycerol lipase n=1 Tax=Symbiochloris irregularis TaxID=706552 RepID=A0AAW1NJS9_9CHLO
MPFGGHNELWENERYLYGLGWQRPGLLERPTWSDAQGQGLQVPAPPTVENPRGWGVQVSHSTDSEGWQYASVFKHLEYDRPGGRASHRATDFVRRRCWKLQEAERPASTAQQGQASGNADEKEGMPSHASYLGGKVTDAVRAAVATGQLAEGSLVSPATHMHGSRLRRQAEGDRRLGALRAFRAMLGNTLRRRTLWGMVPLDPAAWLVMLHAHSQALQAQERGQMDGGGKILPLGLHHRDADNPSAPEHQDLFNQGCEPEHMHALLRRLNCAAMHSRAAYGYAMAAGHLSSLVNFALLQTVHQVSFNAAGGASGQANNEAVAALTGVPIGSLLMAEWHNSIGRPCHYLALLSSPKCLLLSIRGSLELGDVLSDLKAEPMEVTLMGSRGKVHEGIMSAATYVHCNTAQALQKAAKQHPGVPLLLTGHSMGGSVATVLAMLLRGSGGAPEGLGPVHCVGIGPAPAVCGPLAAACSEFVTSVVLGADVVPRLSYASVEGAFLDLVNSSPVRNAAASIGRKVTNTFQGLKMDLKTALHTPHWDLPGLPGKWSGSGQGLAEIAELAEDTHAASAAARAASYAEASSSPPGGTNQHKSSGFGIVSAADFAACMAEDQATASKQPGKVDGQQPDTAEQRQEPLQQSHGAETEQEQQQAGEGKSGAEDRSKAAAVVSGRDSQGEHPEPLYLAGRVLWMIPDNQASSSHQGSSGKAKAQAPAELEEWMTKAFKGLEPAGRQEDDKPQQSEKNSGKQQALEIERHSPDKTKSSADKDSNLKQMSVVEVDCKVFERILLTMEMGNDHLPDTYLEAIQML